MKKYLNRIVSLVIVCVLMAIEGLVFFNDVSAKTNGITMSPMNQSIVLIPGDTYEATFTISNSVNSSDDTYYELDVDSFYLDDKSEAMFGTHEDNNKMVDWVRFISPTEGVLRPNEVRDIKFAIDVPDDAPAGGQYASIVAIMKTDEADDNRNDSVGDDSRATIKEVQRIGHLVYAEVAGDTIRDGEIVDANVPGFLLSGNIKGTSLIKNSGNVHGNAKYTLQVYPLFSDEEIYTNEENQDTQIIFPNRTVYSETEWAETPSIGIFNVVYTVEFENAKAEISKMVIICPIWLLFIIIFAIFAAIFYFVAKAKARKKSDTKKEDKESK